MHAGVNDIIKELAVKIQEATGYRCFIPDLYKGKIGVDKEEAHHVSPAHSRGPALPARCSTISNTTCIPTLPSLRSRVHGHARKHQGATVLGVTPEVVCC